MLYKRCVCIENAEEKAGFKMEELYWKQFVTTGKVEDYLSYKGIETCSEIIKKYEDQQRESINHSDRDGNLCIADRRI